MDARTVEQITEWDSRPFSGGFEALRDFADADFSGAVKVGGAWLFMLNGRVVGIFDGNIDSFEDANGEAYEAPHPSLPLLFSMQERGGKTQAKYYTNDTPLEEASSTLSSNKFTGYVELSENVLSGDYYVVYHGGRSMNVAYVGESEKLLTGDEAFQRANDEVGIYEVVAADVDIIDIPEPETPPEPEPEPTPTERQPSESAAESGSESEADSEPVPDSPPESDDDSVPSPPNDRQPAPSSQPSQASSPQTPPSQTTASESEPTPETEPTQTQDSPRRATPEEKREQKQSQSSQPTQSPQSSDSASETKTPASFSDEQQWRETTTIPSLDPEKSSSSKSRNTGVKQRRNTRQSPQRQSQNRNSRGAPASSSNRTKELEAELTARAKKIEALQTELKSVEVERDELKQERDRLQNELDQLRIELETVRQNSPGVTAERQITPQQAFTETNLFVRYGSKGKGTLADAAAGDASRETIESNLKLEHHTQFDVDGIAVDGKEYETFLHESMEYQFVSWLVVDLLYEIIETGHQRGLKDLFEGIQEIDRAELQGTLTAETEEGEERELSFDVILRDRMGNPLVVANINDSRDPATGEMLGSLVDASSDVASANNELSAAFQVTKSFFEPAALETTEDATSGGLLTREKRESFVKLSRKRGYHLCLVESRNGEFHLTVPEL
ncbi:DUF7527 domain-containing protein [Haladaptatus cibarius]|uniref:DUF7527 domain-containing protein n=1 Tax=Haladaptatus cibarius TaxID=453847 RepID=UPI000678E553|nr:hypothetical protein [Haladaptatus cibarius]